MYKSRDKRKLDFSHLIKYICNVRHTEMKLCQFDARKTQKFNKKWSKINTKLDQA